MNKTFSITPLGDSAIMIEWEQRIAPSIHEQVMSAFHYLQSLRLSWITGLIPAYASLSVLYDTVLIRQQAKRPAGPWVSDFICKTLCQAGGLAATAPRSVQIPVCYDPALAPDLNSMAQQKGLTVSDIITLHAARTYTVYMLGFLPGFPYMGTVDAALATPRLKQPRLQVPAGSVGIAGEQTGVYPLASPGGWNIIGQTPVRLFDPGQEDPCYCKPGDVVQFVPITLEMFHQMQQLS